jgi:hypothetical protein
MKAPKLSAAILALVLSACAQDVETVVPSPAPPSVAPTPPQPPAHTATEVDAAAIGQAERDLKTLGYAAGKSDEINDATLRRAILAFEKDQGLAEDGQLSPAVQERLKQLRSAMLGRNSAPTKRNGLRVYSDGTISSTGINPVPPLAAGLASDAAADFLHPARPGSESNFHLGHRTHEGVFVATKSVSCHTGHMIRSNMAFGATDLLAVDCHLEGDDSHAWHSLYSPALDTVVQQDGAGKSRILVAIRPSTGNWPVAARTGLDWAITHALETPASDTPVQWSSTGVAQHFEVRAYGRISGRELGLAGKHAAINCRRFELAANDRPPSRYPGIACQNGNGVWTIAGTGIALSSPAKAMTMRSAVPDRNGAPSP